MSDKTNPNSVWGPNQNYANNLNLSRPDASTVGPGGNVVDRARINRNGAGLDENRLSPQKPLGEPQTDGFGG